MFLPETTSCRLSLGVLLILAAMHTLADQTVPADGSAISVALREHLHALASKGFPNDEYGRCKAAAWLDVAEAAQKSGDAVLHDAAAGQAAFLVNAMESGDGESSGFTPVIPQSVRVLSSAWEFSAAAHNRGLTTRICPAACALAQFDVRLQTLGHASWQSGTEPSAAEAQAMQSMQDDISRQESDCRKDPEREKRLAAFRICPVVAPVAVSAPTVATVVAPVAISAPPALPTSTPTPPAPKPAPPAAPLHIPRVVYFALDKYSLSGQTRKVLVDVARLLRARPQASAVLTGYTDSRAHAQYNHVLGLHRAEAVRDFLVANGIAAARLQTRSVGINQQHDTDQRTAFALARRVEIVYDGLGEVETLDQRADLQVESSAVGHDHRAGSKKAARAKRSRQ